ncbi:MurR/RpiR family transcriptional regulator [Enterococcus sp. LJL99]
MQQNIIFTIQDHRQNLPKSEQKIADYIIKHINEVITLSAQELAKKADSSPAAIIRFCHSINVNGFTELKLLLSANLGATNSENYTEVEDSESTAAIKQKLQSRIVHVLERTTEALNEQAIDEAVLAIEEASVIYVYGLGASSLVAQDIYQKFTRLGKMVFCTLDHLLLASAIGTNHSKSILICISNSGMTSEVIALAELAKKSGTMLIALTKNSASSLAEKGDILLVTAEADEAPLRSAATVSLTAQLYVVDVLFFAYASKNYDESIEKVQNSRKAVKVVKQHS